jgi:hypothetical protein
MLDPPSPLAKISLVELQLIFQQHNRMRDALGELRGTIERQEPPAAMLALIDRSLGEVSTQPPRLVNRSCRATGSKSTQVVSAQGGGVAAAEQPNPMADRARRVEPGIWRVPVGGFFIGGKR